MPKGESELDRFYPLSVANRRYRELADDLTEKEGSQTKAASKLGISQSYVSSIRLGTRNVSAAAVELACQRIGLDPMWFFLPYAGDWTEYRNPGKSSLRGEDVTKVRKKRDPEDGR